MKKFKIRERAAYNFDKIMDKGTFALILFLLVVTLFVSIVAGVVLSSVQAEWSGGSLINSIWKSFLLTLDPGNQLAIEGNFKLVAITAVMTFCGIAFITTLIGIINSGITNKYDQLRQGTSKVIENEHTVVLGFNDNIYRIVSELIKANEEKDIRWYKPKPRIVILGNEDISVMEQKINDRILKTIKHTEIKEEKSTYGVDKKSRKKTKLIFRNGIPSNLDDLGKCSVERSNSVIINEHEDTEVIKIILAVSKILNNHHSDASRVFIVTAINDIDDKEVAKIAGEWGDNEESDGELINSFAEVLCFNDIISKIVAQTLFQPGLSDVYRELFDFSGNEIHIVPFENEMGNKFSDLLNFYINASVIGIIKEKKTILRPSMNTELCDTDEIILIAKDANSLEKCYQERNSFIIKPVSVNVNDEKRKTSGILVFGYNHFLEVILSEWSQYFKVNEENTPVVIFVKSERERDMASGFVGKYDKLNLMVEVCDNCYKSSLERVKSENYEHILVLSDLACDVQKSDAETMALLMRLRKRIKGCRADINITSQMLDIRNRELAQVANVNDFIVSSDLISLMLTQISQNRELTPIFNKLLSAEGSEIYLKPASLYIDSSEKIKIGDIVEYAAKVRGELFIGYKKAKVFGNNKQESGIVINPLKTDEVSFTKDDMIIVVSEN